MAVTNTLAYYHKATLIAIKFFIVHTPGDNPIKLFTAVIYGFP
jgi:hypothetical protein